MAFDEIENPEVNPLTVQGICAQPPKPHTMPNCKSSLFFSSPNQSKVHPNAGLRPPKQSTMPPCGRQSSPQSTVVPAYGRQSSPKAALRAEWVVPVRGNAGLRPGLDSQCRPSAGLKSYPVPSGLRPVFGPSDRARRRTYIFLYIGIAHNVLYLAS